MLPGPHLQLVPLLARRVGRDQRGWGAVHGPSRLRRALAAYYRGTDFGAETNVGRLAQRVPINFQGLRKSRRSGGPVQAYSIALPLSHAIHPFPVHHEALHSNTLT